MLEEAAKLLEEQPLCDRCLGRLYARLGRGWNNKDRGRALKMSVIMWLHREAAEGSVDAKKRFRIVASNAGEVGRELYKHLYGEDPGEARCRICGSMLDKAIGELAEEAAKVLRLYDARKIVVGARVSQEILEAEDEVKARYGIKYGESIKAEIRREVGKLLRDKHGYTIDFDEPDAMVIVGFPSLTVEIQNNSLLLRGRYWKRGRMISQAYWPTPSGPKYYSIEQAAWSLLQLTGGETVILHAAGREDVDARMLGTGRPMILEIKNPRRRYISLGELEEAANKGAPGLVEFRFTGRASRRDIQIYKEEAQGKAKVYKALVLLEEPVDRDRLKAAVDTLKGATISQWTPRRVLHRRRNLLRRKKVLDMDCTLLHSNLAECIIRTEGGLYVKELISGDEGRTSPSLSEALGVGATCVELDVLGVEAPDIELLEERGSK
ncbi:MAG: tRNA pseudouridine(54/55) synthase Pus10 [Desulfurococcales archaeon]|nr:tRNA pseudouridine(54/55) synthase Pus10 [Desulfurococcales archaeon]